MSYSMKSIPAKRNNIVSKYKKFYIMLSTSPSGVENGKLDKFFSSSYPSMTDDNQRFAELVADWVFALHKKIS